MPEIHTDIKGIAILAGKAKLWPKQNHSKKTAIQ